MLKRILITCGVLAGFALAPAVRASGLPPVSTLFDGQPVENSASAPEPRVVVVWMKGCAPCLEELRHLKEIAARTPGWGYVTLALDEPDLARAALPAEAAFATAWVAAGQPAEVLARLNPDKPALPLALALNKRGEVCARRVGLLGSDIVNGWTASCSK